MAFSCREDTVTSAETQARAGDDQTAESRVVDLEGAELAGHPHLGVELSKSRPSLTDSCTWDHYAERLSPSYLRLSCTVSRSGLYAERLRIGVAEDPERARLAFLVRERSGPEYALAALAGLARARVAARLGPPHVDEPGLPLVWQGHTAQSADQTSLELATSHDRDMLRGVVRETYRHHELIGRLDNPGPH